MKKAALLTFVLCLIVGGAYAIERNPRASEIVDYSPGHTHQGSTTKGAIEHGGGLDRYGCHNKSVPYHCH